MGSALLVAGIISGGCSRQESPETQFEQTNQAYTGVWTYCRGGWPAGSYVSYCGSRQGRVFIEVISAPPGMQFGNVSMNDVGAYSPPRYTYQGPSLVGQTAPVIFRAWMDVQHTQRFNIVADPYEEVVAYTDPVTGEFTDYPNFLLAEPPAIASPYPPGGLAAFPFNSGAVVNVEPIIDPATFDLQYEHYEITASPVHPAPTSCVSQSVTIRATSVELAFVPNLVNNCDYTFAYRGVTGGSPGPYSASTGAVTIGDPNPSGSFVVSTDWLMDQTAVPNTADTYIIAMNMFGDVFAAKATAAPYGSTYFRWGASMNLPAGPYDFTMVVDVDADGELELTDQVPPNATWQQYVNITSNQTLYPGLLNGPWARAETVHTGFRDPVTGLISENWWADVVVSGIREGVVGASYVGASLHANAALLPSLPSTLSARTEFHFADSYETVGRADEWRMELAYPSAPPLTPGYDQFRFEYIVDTSNSESGPATSVTRTAWVNIFPSTFVSLPSGLGITWTAGSGFSLNGTAPSVPPDWRVELVVHEAACGFACATIDYSERFTDADFPTYGAPVAIPLPMSLAVGVLYQADITLRSPSRDYAMYSHQFYY
jgi:hypothetical protein